MTRLCLALAAISLLLPATAAAAPAPLHPDGVVSAAAKKKKSTTPVITKITPKRANVGDKLTITGKNFISGKEKNRVFFYRSGGGSAWVKAEKASKTKIVVTIPEKLEKLLPADGKEARIQLRVLAKKFGTMSTRSKSPLIALIPSNPVTDGNGTTTGGGSGAGGGGVTLCTPNEKNPASDVDNDQLTDATELTYKTDPCNADSDGDGPTDSYEFYSAKDLNTAALPYPAKRPYPNPLFADADIDFDGDGLHTADEYALWVTFGNKTFPMNYSAGKRTTTPIAAPDPSGPLWYLDMNGDGSLSDDEQDADGDALGNWDESHGSMIPSWWDSAYSKDPAKETPYPVKLSGGSMLDPDSDGDGVLDGADDYDFDGLTNSFEIERPGNWLTTYVATGPGSGNYHNFDGIGPVDPLPLDATVSYSFYARVQPFNPCKPVYSGTCHFHPEFGYYPDDEDWMGYGVPGSGQVLPPPGARPADV